MSREKNSKKEMGEKKIMNSATKSHRIARKQKNSKGKFKTFIYFKSQP